MRVRHNTVSVQRRLRRIMRYRGVVLGCLPLGLALGCAPAVHNAVKVTPATTTAPVQPLAPIVNVAPDASGFTITQQVPISDDVRADYDAAIRIVDTWLGTAMREARYIRRLLKVRRLEQNPE